ncbi:MAG TPA: glucose-1-phosphate cytidylyltransferase [Pyrinomonadaceae bacterium]|nr:glucose-1-phosphate cytidylyltransferase [Pyrinomonadaceae bacterium]
MKVVILCGGQGTRLREQTEILPKPMVDIGGRPILWHIMKTYAHFGLQEFVLCLGYKGHIIKEYFVNYDLRTTDFDLRLGDKSSINVLRDNDESDWRVSLIETGEQAMTGARVFRVKDQLNNEAFCLTYGDGLGSVDIRALLDFHKRHGKLATVTGVRPPGRFGELELDGDQVVAFAEKPQVTESFINGGFFVLDPAFIERYLSDDDELTLEREPLQNVAADGELMMFPHTGFWQPMDTFREWKMLEELWESGGAPWKMWA